ncbi:hypothetical protein LPUS_08747 [Lasallia pustulata]|uniref:Uncharacterized protein n=1 Tax=Lasallia pustulata TaxID=136370 RepID=A0A1W5D625_9LECA|nr:hypothetical protein LPUS_08747 [Lasallia pustulata]
MSGPSFGQTPRSSTSPAPSATSSLTAHSGAGSSVAEYDHAEAWSSHGGRSDGRPNQRGDHDQLAFDSQGAISARNNDEEGEREIRRHRPRTSGGFLLESIPATPSSQRTSKGHTMHGVGSGPEDKGKGKSEDADLHIQKRRSAHPRHGPKPSLGRSPLATVVTNESLSHESSRRSTQDQDEIISVPSNGSGKTGYHVDGDLAAGTNLRVSGDQRLLRPDPPPVNGFDMDSAQIVSLALNLSESRRRTTSAGGVPSVDGVGGRRHVSTGQLSAGLVMTGGSLRQHLQPQRRTSRNISPRLTTLGRPSPDPVHTGAWESPGSRSRSINASSINGSSIDNIPLEPSDATLSRAERARISLELSYEYRRLLQYLPALPVPSTSRPSTAKATSRKAMDNVQELGRSYNPLQYIRNRKVRARERKTFNAEAEGWKDVERVQEWVNKVAADRKGVTTVIDTDAPLPPYETPEGVKNNDASPVSSLRHPNGPRTTKQSRPRLDWMTTPWDLLADAYWLEQESNKKLIEDRHGNKLYLGISRLTSHQSRFSQDQPRVPNYRSDSIPRNLNRSESPETAPSTQGSVRQDSFGNERGRRQHHLRESIHSLQEQSGSRERKGPWHRNLIRSRSSSSSSRGGYMSRGRKHHKHSSIRDNFDSAVLEKQMMEMLEREIENDQWGTLGGVEGDMSEQIDHSRAQQANREGTGVTTGPRKTSARSERGEPLPDNPRSDYAPTSTRVSFDAERGQKPRTSFEDVDNTAPSSPTTDGFVPSIAINLSPPASRSVSPTKKPLSSRLSNFKSSRSKERQFIDENDFAVEVGSTRSGLRPAVSKGRSAHYTGMERAASPVDGLLSPKSAEKFGKELRRSGSKKVKGSKEFGEPESRLWGLLKGPGKIGETVGSGVSKVGYLLWKRDNAGNNLRAESPVSSYPSEPSDSDYDSGAGGRTRYDRGRQSGTGTDDEDLARLSRKSTNNESPKYHISNLPSFKSSFKRDEQARSPNLGLPDDHHITRQQREQKERGRSSRFEQLAPPKMDMRSISPSPSRPGLASRTAPRGRESDPSSRGSRPSSLAPSVTGVRRASQGLNTILGLPGTFGRHGTFAPPVTGLAGLDVRRRSSQLPDLERKRHWSISDRGVPDARGTVTRRDIDRVRALLLSSGIKANEICRRAQEIRDPPSPLLQKLKAITKAPLPEVSRSQEHVLAARILVRNIDDGNAQLKEAAERLRINTVDRLHDQIKAIDEKISSTLTPLVRACADEADAFGAELTTTHTLSVKQLNDSLNTMMRRRRRRLKWVRKGGYVLLEWTLLGIMWWVWLIVVIIKFFRGAIVALIRGLRWLFWL